MNLIITPLIKEIGLAGLIKIAFKPPEVKVPTNFNVTTFKARDFPQLISINFIKNSDEQVQDYFTYNVTSFTRSELWI